MVYTDALPAFSRDAELVFMVMGISLFISFVRLQVADSVYTESLHLINFDRLLLFIHIDSRRSFASPPEKETVRNR